MRMVLVRFHSVPRSFTITRKHLPPWKTRQKLWGNATSQTKSYIEDIARAKLKGINYKETKKKKKETLDSEKGERVFLARQSFCSLLLSPTAPATGSPPGFSQEPNWAPLLSSHQAADSPSADGCDSSSSGHGFTWRFHHNYFSLGVAQGDRSPRDGPTHPLPHPPPPDSSKARGAAARPAPAPPTLEPAETFRPNPAPHMKVLRMRENEKKQNKYMRKRGGLGTGHKPAAAWLSEDVGHLSRHPLPRPPPASRAAGRDGGGAGGGGSRGCRRKGTGQGAALQAAEGLAPGGGPRPAAGVSAPPPGDAGRKKRDERGGCPAPGSRAASPQPHLEKKGGKKASTAGRQG